MPHMKDRDLQLLGTEKRILFDQPLKKKGFILRSISLAQSVLIPPLPVLFQAVK